MANEIYDIPVTTIDGKDTNLGEYKDKVLMLVNVASKCGLTPQYTALEKLYEENRDKGFEVLGFPANNFAGQEPGTEEEIKDFCDTNYSVEFPLFSKISVKGDDQHPLYKYLIEERSETDINNGEGFVERLKNFGHTKETPTEVLWNFEKFLIGKKGEVVARIAPDVTPDDPRVAEKIAAELNK
jgi:glutathione peroxidase